MPELGQLRRHGARTGSHGEQTRRVVAKLTSADAAAAGARAETNETVPPLREITAYYRDMYHRTKLKFDCIVLSLIYVERLMKVWGGGIGWCNVRVSGADLCVVAILLMCGFQTTLQVWCGPID